MSDNMIHTDPTKRHDFVLLFDVMQGNPNGATLMPRTCAAWIPKPGTVSDV